MISPADNSAGCPRPIPSFLGVHPPYLVDRVLDREVRALRDKVYGPCTDNNWLACRELWLTPDSIAWLREEAGKDT